MGQRLALVLTKMDLVQTSPNQGRAESDFVALHANVERLFRNVFPVIQTFKVAASPKSDAVQRGTGVPELLTFWLQPAAPPPTSSPPRPVFSRAFARLRPLNELEDAK